MKALAAKSDDLKGKNKPHPKAHIYAVLVRCPFDSFQRKELSLWLRALANVVEDQSLVPSNYSSQLTTVLM